MVSFDGYVRIVAGIWLLNNELLQEVTMRFFFFKGFALGCLVESGDLDIFMLNNSQGALEFFVNYVIGL